MKKLLLFTAGLLLMGFMHVSAQNSNTTEPGKSYQETMLLGPVAGFGNSWVSNLPGNILYKTSGYAGIGLIELKNQHWGWGGQITLSSEGYAVDDFGSVQTIKPLYLRVPVRAYYFFGKRNDWVRPNLYLGPSFGLKMAEYYTVSNVYYETYMAHNSSYFRTLDAGINGGAGLNFRLTGKMWLDVDLGFYQGLVDAVKDPDNTFNPNHDVDLNLGLLFNIK